MSRAVLALAAILGVLLASPAAADAARFQTRIVGGGDATRPWPAQGYLTIQRPDGTFACGGTLVSGRWLLTAAHCVTDPADTSVLPAGAFTVRLGSANRTLGTLFRVSDVVRHSLYNPATESNDVALLELNSAPPLGAAIAPLRLIAANESGLWSPGKLATIIGWGTTCFQGCATTTNLREAGVPIVSDASCASAYGGKFVPTTMLCAGNGSTDACQGDSGGPLMVPRVDVYVLVGVTSTGFGCGDPAFPGIYARLGAPEINATVRAQIPTVRIDSAAFTQWPDVGQAVDLSATGTSGSHGPPEPAFVWSVSNLDGQCSFSAVSGSNATLVPDAAGSCAVTAQQVYSDGDRAVAREVITTNGSPRPPPPPPPPVAPPPPPVAPPPPPPPPPLPIELTPRLSTLSAPTRIRVRSLLDGRFSVRVRCFASCRLTSVMNLDPRTARRLGLTRRVGRAVRVGSGSARYTGPGRYRLTLRIPRNARVRLRPARSGRLTLFVAARRYARTENHKRIIRLVR